jgi:small subunit ribosomal protein S1
MDELPVKTELSMADIMNYSQMIRSGKIIKGTVVQINSDYVIINIGYKTEGTIPTSEFLDLEGNITIHVGDVVNAVVEKIRNDHGMVNLSIQRLEKINRIQQLEKIFQSESFVKGKIIEKIKGGFKVDLGLITGFLPMSQITLIKNKLFQESDWINKIFFLKIIKLDFQKHNIVLSHRAFLEYEKEALQNKILQTLTPGSICSGVVKNITDYGIFVDLGGIDGLIHQEDIDWDSNFPKNKTTVGEKLQIMVLNLDYEKKRISLGLKQLMPNPWIEINQKYAIGQQLEVEIIKKSNSGIWVRVDELITGFVPKSECSWFKKLNATLDSFLLNTKKNAEILEISPEKRKILLSFKKVEKDPKDLVKEIYPIGSIVLGIISNILDFGILVELKDPFEGIIYNTDLSWHKNWKLIKNNFKIHQEISSTVLDWDSKKKIILGLKQSEEDPWTKISEKYKVGQVITGNVIKLNEHGAFIDLDNQVEGLLHKSKLKTLNASDPQNQVKVGDMLNVMITNIDISKRTISFSLPIIEKKPKDFDPILIERKTNSFKKMLEKFLKQTDLQ